MSSPSSTSTHRRIGFIGLGIMGAPMAGHLVDAGHVLYVHTRGDLPAALEGRVTVCQSGSEVARQSEVVILMVPDTPDVEAVLFGPDGVEGGLSASKTVVDCSSIDPIATRRFAARIARADCHYVDAPVSGGEVGARAASLTIMCGGEPAAFEQVLPLLSLMGKNVTRVGGVGDGQVCKVANQIIVALNIAAVAEALVFARKAGADPARVREALMGGFASSRVLEVHGQRMLARRFEPGFRIGLHQKDLNLALQGARALGVALPQTAQAAQLMNTCAALGHEASDHSALLVALESLSGLEVEG